VPFTINTISKKRKGEGGMSQKVKRGACQKGRLWVNPGRGGEQLKHQQVVEPRKTGEGKLLAEIGGTL